MRMVHYQLARLITDQGDRWCILSDSGDGWFKLVQDFPLGQRDAAEEVLERIVRDRNGVGDVAATARRTFHHRV